MQIGASRDSKSDHNRVTLKKARSSEFYRDRSVVFDLGYLNILYIQENLPLESRSYT
jgi:hypothetical protein